MADFDPIRAVRDELVGLAKVEAAIRQRERASEEAIGQAEAELNAIRKIRGFLRIVVEAKRDTLSKLEDAAQK